MAEILTIKEIQDATYNYLKSACFGFLDDVNNDIFFSEDTQMSKVPSSYVYFMIDNLKPKNVPNVQVDQNLQTDNATSITFCSFDTVIMVVAKNTYDAFNLAHRIYVFESALQNNDYTNKVGITKREIIRDITSIENNVNKINIRLVLGCNANIKQVFDIGIVEKVTANFSVKESENNEVIANFSSVSECV